MTEPKCLCPPGLTGLHCELSHYCEDMRPQTCGGVENKCKVLNKNYACECTGNHLGHGCVKSIEIQLFCLVLSQNFIYLFEFLELEDHLPGYLNQIKREKLLMDMEACKFGRSIQSQIFIGIIAIFILSFFIIGLITGHRLIKQYKK